jgi:hypothetical protein
VSVTVVRVRRVGLVVQPRPKSEAGWRVVALPEYAVRTLQGRPRGGADAGRESLAFTAPRAGELRDRNNVSGDLRQLLDAFDCDLCPGAGYQPNADGSFVAAPTAQVLKR